MSPTRITWRPKRRTRVTTRRVYGLEPPLLTQDLVVFTVDDPPIIAPFGPIMGFGAVPTTEALELDVTGACPRTPNINALAKKGRIFRRFFTNSQICSPTRASLFGGVEVFRHGVSMVVRIGNAGKLAEFGDPGFAWSTVATRLREARLAGEANVRSRLIGKMHQSIAHTEQFESEFGDTTWDGRFGSGYDIIQRLGYDEWSVVLRNLDQNDGFTPPASRGYYHYALLRHTSQTPQVLTRYATSQQIDELIDFFDSRSDPDERLFADVRVNSVHTPYQKENFPPLELVTTQAYVAANEPGTSGWPVPMAGMEALDREIGRFMASRTPAELARITFVIMADNGTHDVYYLFGKDVHGVDYGALWNRLIGTKGMKDSPYRLGGNWPMIWAGPRPGAYGLANPGSVHSGLVSSVDMYPTILGYFGIEDESRDGRSILEAAWNDAPTTRTIQLTEKYEPMGYFEEAQEALAGFRAILSTPFNGLTGYFSLIKILGQPDECFHLEELDGTPVDEWEDRVLDPTLYADVYTEMNRLLTELRESTLGGPGDLFLPFETRDGEDGFVATDEDENIPFQTRTGGAGVVVTVDGRLPFLTRSGATGYVTLVDKSEASGWALEFELRNPSVFGPHVLLDPDDKLPFTTRSGGIGKVDSADGALPGDNRRLPFTTRDGATGYVTLAPQ